MNTACITTNYIGINEICILCNTPISQEKIRRIIDTSNSPIMIEWSFDGNLNDAYGHYNGILTNSNIVLWISPGYVGYGYPLGSIPQLFLGNL